MPILVALIAALPALGTSIIFPTYSAPVVVEETLIVLPPDRMALIGVAKTGKPMWRRPLSSEGAVIAHRSGKALLIQGASVSSLNPKSGKIELLFRAVPKVEWLNYSTEGNLFWGTLEKDSSILALFDGDTHACLATKKNGEMIDYADADLVVLTKARRKKNKDGGYSFSKVWIEGFHRKTMRKLWSAPFVNNRWPYHDVVRCDDHIVCADGSDLVLVDAKSGRVQRRQITNPQDLRGPTGLRNDKGSLVYLVSGMIRGNYDQREHTLYKLSVPELNILETRVVKVIEAASTEAVGDLLITDALYRTACFRRNGTKIWDHFQLHRTSPVDGVIYFSDHRNGVARMGALKLATGKMRIFISERIGTF